MIATIIGMVRQPDGLHFHPTRILAVWASEQSRRGNKERDCGLSMLRRVSRTTVNGREANRMIIRNTPWKAFRVSRSSSFNGPQYQLPVELGVVPEDAL